MRKLSCHRQWWGRRHSHGEVPASRGCCLSIAFSVVALTACSSKQDATAGNFEHALNTWLKEKPLCTAVTPMSSGEADRFLTAMRKGNATQVAAVERARQDLPAHKAQLVSTPIRGMLESSNDGTPERVRILEVLAKAGFTHGNDAYSYTPSGLFAMKEAAVILNEEGVKHLRQNTVGSGLERRTITSICYGDLVVDKVVRWSAPADLMGHRVSEVEFTVKHQSVPNWALPMLVYVEPERKALLVLTSDGWTVDR